MAEDYSPYFLSIIASRAMAIHEDEYLSDGNTLSLETQLDLMGESIFSYILDNFSGFITNILPLSDEDREILLSYYLVGKTQTTLAIVNRSTQTLCSSKIRAAAKRLGAALILGEVTQDNLERLLNPNHAHLLPEVSIGQLVHLYATQGSSQRVAEILGIHRPVVRRTLTQLVKALTQAPDLTSTALAAYVQGLIDRSSSQGHGPSKSRLLARGNLSLKDPDILGRFEIDVLHPDFSHVFSPRANQ